MRTKNTYYTTKNDFNQFLKENSFLEEKNLLIQIFSSLLSKELLDYILMDIQELVPQAKIIGSTTDGEILENRVSIDSIVVSISSFERASLRVAMEINDEDSFQCGENLAKKLIQDDTKAIF